MIGAILDADIVDSESEVLAGLFALCPTCPVVLLIAQYVDLRRIAYRAVLEKPFGLSAFSAHLDSFLGEAAQRAD